MINLGDFNLVGGPQPENTLVTGDIQDESTYGPDVKGDWDESDMTDLHPTDPFTGDDFTWQGSYSYPPSRLDRFFYTDSVVTVANSFILNTDTMTQAALSVAGLQATDTLPDYSSDHLPLAMDLRLPTVPECTGDPDCDDGAFCTGAETCDGNGHCQPGTPVDCDDGVGCTVDSCNEGTDSCDNVPTDGVCDNGLYCDGVEICDAQLDCQSGAYPCASGHWCYEDGAECIAHGSGDFEPDGDVDLADFAAFQRCFGALAGSDCYAANLTGTNGEIDLEDFGEFQEAFTGP
jgi:hypothetical protein